MPGRLTDALRRPAGLFLLSLFGLAVLFRVWLFVIALIHLPLSAEEAWPGLMASHILKGATPAIYWGQPYLGTALSYVHAPIIAIFGATTFGIRLLDLAAAMVFVVVSYFLAKKIYGRETGVITVALLAIPAPYLAMSGALVPPDNYLSLITAGSLCLLLLADLTVGEQPAQKPWKFALLGLILGIAFWVHLIMVSYIAVVLLFLFLRDKLFFIRRGFWLMLTSFFIGSLPLWSYNFTNEFATFADVGKTAHMNKFIATAMTLPEMTLQFILGTKVMLYADNSNHEALPFAVSLVVWLLLGGLLLIVIVSRRRHVSPLFRLSLKGADGTGILVVFMLVVLLTFCKSARSNWDSPRYILPLMSAFPVLVACGLVRIRERTQAGFVALLVLLIGAQAWGNALLVGKWQDPEVVSFVLDLPDTRDLVGFLEKQNIRHTYTHYWFSYRLNYETGEKLVCTQPYNERFMGREVRLADEVAAADRVAYILHKRIGPDPDYFEWLLKNAGGKFRRRQLGIFTVFYDFVPPYGKVELKELPHDSWKITASHNAADLGNVLDSKHDTAWSTDGAQTEGMWLQVDLGATQSVAMVRYSPGKGASDYPRGYKVEVSPDGSGWKKVFSGSEVGESLFWSGSHPRYVIACDYYGAAFPLVDARFVRMAITEGHRSDRWSIAQLRIFGPTLRTQASLPSR
ncbi:MAG: hypothetical protein C0404_02805 [Verrucomicrobia bacterium]|nr:hypothetical protein [Verrucomicrobiota bacterium]